MRSINIVLLLLIVFTFSSCKKKDLGDCFKSTGDVVEQERDVGEFNTIIVNNNVSLILIPSESNMLTVSAGENLLDKIITEKQGDSLIISNNNSCNWVRDFSVPITVFIPVNQLKEINYRSIGDINCTDTIYSDTLTINVLEGSGTLNILTHAYKVNAALQYGTADIMISGRCHLSFVYSASFGLIDNRGLMCNQVYVGNKSSNDIYLRVDKYLGATIEGIGNIYYTGNPESFSFNQVGSGNLIKLSE